MAAVKIAGVGDIEVLHAFAEVAKRGFNQKMEMAWKTSPKCFMPFILQEHKCTLDIIPQYEKCLQLMEMNPFHPSLRLHPLHGRLKWLSSISITMSYCIAAEFVIDEKEILLLRIGTHDEVSA